MSTQFTNRQWRLPNNENKDKQSNYSMKFDGSSEYIDIPDGSIDLGIESTVSMWVNLTGTYAYALLGEDSYTSDYLLYIDSSKIYFRVGGSYLEWSNSSDITSGNWHHILITRNSSNVGELFIDGNSKGTNSTWQGGDPGTIATKFDRIGARHGTLNATQGKLDAVAVFDYALTDGTGGTVNQIATLYGSSSTGIGNPMSLSPKPVSYYPLGDQDSFNGADYLVPNSSLKDYVFDYLTTNSYIDTNFTLPAYTSYSYSIWYKQTSSFTGDNYLIGNLPQGSGSIADMRVSVRFNGGTKLRFLTGNDTTSFQSTDLDVSSLLLDGNWHHISIIVVSGEIKLYIDSNLENTYSNANIVTGISANRSYALGFSGNTQYAGYLDNSQLSNFQIFNTALPATGSNSIETLYNNGSPLTSMSGFTSLQGWWKLDASATYDGTDWSIPDDSSNSNDGTSSGMTQANLVQSDLSFTSGYSPYALNFDGTSNYIDCGATVQQPTTNYSVSCWVKLDSIAGNTGIVGNFKTPSFPQVGFALTLSSGLNFQFWADGTASSNAGTVTGTTTPNSSTWYNVIGTYNGSLVKIYVNNVLENSVSYSATPNATDQNLVIGRWYGNYSDYYTNGSISNVSIWNTALTPAQVTEVYAEGIPQNLNNHSAYSNLVSWWQLGSNSSFNTNWTVLDEKGSNNGLSSVNMTEVDIVDGVGSYANGLSSGMGGDEVIGDAPYSSSNSLSVNMDVEDRTTDTPS